MWILPDGAEHSASPGDTLTTTVLLYYITDRTQFPGSASGQRHRLLDKVAEAAEAALDYIQIREKDLSARELEQLCRDAVSAVRAAKDSRTRLLVNSRSDIVLATGCDGVHLPANDISAGDARALWQQVRPNPAPLIAVSCHSAEEVRMAESQGADFAVLAPIFGKRVLEASSVPGMEYETVLPGIGLEALREACGQAVSPEHTEAPPRPTRMPVLALGGVTPENAAQCIAAGAAGIAGIRIFQENEISEVRDLLLSADEHPQ